MDRYTDYQQLIVPVFIKFNRFYFAISRYSPPFRATLPEPIINVAGLAIPRAQGQRQGL